MTLQPVSKILQPQFLLWALFITTFGIVYGSLLPFELRHVSANQAIDQFLNIQWLNLKIQSRADFLANFIIYVPFGFFACGAVCRRGMLLAAILAAAFGTGLAVGIEFAQIFFAPRTVSLNDIAAEIAGTGFGMMAWVLFGRQTVNLVAKSVEGNHAAFRAGLLIYVFVYIGIEAFPFDFFISIDELSERLHSGQAIVWISSHYGDNLRFFAEIFNKVLSAVPVGAFIYLLSRNWVKLAWAGASLAVGLEIIQFFEYSGDADVFSAVLRFVGYAAGFGILSALTGNGVKTAMPRWAVICAWIAIPFYIVFLNYLLNQTQERSLQTRADILNEMHWIPFYYYYFTSEQRALSSLVNLLKAYLPLGVIFWVILRSNIRNAVWITFLATAAIEIGVEFMGFWVYLRRPDATNAFIAGTGGLLGFAVCNWLWKSLNDSEKQRAHDSPDSRVNPQEV